MDESGFLPLPRDSEEQPQPFGSHRHLGWVDRPLRQLVQAQHGLLVRFAIPDARELADDGSCRTERGSVRIRARAPVNHEHAVIQARHELGHQPGLADAGLTQDGDEHRPPSRGREIQALAKDRLLAGPADKGDGAAGRAGGERLDGKRGELQLEALRPQPAPVAIRNRLRSERAGGLPGQDLTGPGRRLQAGRHVHDGPGHQQLAGRPHPGRGLPRLDADPHLEGSRQAFGAAEAPHALADRHTRPDGSDRIVLMDMGQAEHRHDGVADELLRAAAQGLQLLGRGLEESAHHLARAFRIQRLRQPRRVDQVGEQDGDHLAFLRAEQGADNRAAVRAKPGARLKRLTADGA